MSYLQYSLDVLDFKSMDDVTTESLKRSFKKHVITTHPDKGGSEGEFDMLLNAYLYLCEMVQRLSGGRAALQRIDAPNELKESRANQLINEIFEEMMQDQHRVHDKDTVGRGGVPADFHEQFMKQRDATKGYQEWLSEATISEATSLISDTDTKTLIGKIDEKDFNTVFESAECTKPTIVQTLILHPDEMAYHTGTTMGTAIIDNSDNFTSDPGLNPEYCDLYAAYTSENTVYNKVYKVENERCKTLEDLILERETVYDCYKDEDLEAIADYEQKKMDQEKKHKNNMENYFGGSMKALEMKPFENTVINGASDFCITIGK